MIKTSKMSDSTEIDAGVLPAVLLSSASINGRLMA